MCPEDATTWQRKNKNNEKKKPKTKKQQQPILVFTQDFTLLSILKPIIFSDKLYATTMHPDMVLPFVLAHSVRWVPLAFQIHGLCPQALPCPKLSPKVQEYVSKTLASAHTEMGAQEKGP